MNKKIGPEITKSIQSGEYFKDAQEWYVSKYISPVVHRSCLVVLTIASLLMAVVAIRVFISFLPLVEIVPIAVDVESKVDEVSKLNYLGKKTEDSNESLIKYLVVRYIEARENYEYESFKNGDKLKYLKDFSSREVFDKYKEYINDSTLSPIFVYKKYTNRTIIPLEVTIINNGRNTDKDGATNKERKVSVKFKAIEAGFQETKSSTWLATLLVNFEKIEYSKEIKKFSPLDFKVVYYEVTKLGDE